MNIDQSAPLKARKEVVVAAPLTKVWTVLTEIDSWSEWQPDVSFAKLEGKLAVGAIFRWKAKGLDITSTVQQLEPRRRISWTGRSIGMKAIHIWILKPQDNDTRVITEESLSGWFPQILKIFDRTFLEKSLIRSLQVLKSQAERQ